VVRGTSSWGMHPCLSWKVWTEDRSYTHTHTHTRLHIHTTLP
jgi:hypothetical protein